MSSRKERREQKISQETCQREEAVNTQGTAEGRSSIPVQMAEEPRESGVDLLEKVLGRENLLQALHRVERNRGAAGVDGMDLKSLRPYLMTHYEELREQLLKGTYQPKPVRRVEIPKPDGGVRLLGIPTVLDRLIQQALLQELTPIFDPGFSEHSFGFRPGRRAHDAVKLARQYIQEGYRYVVDMDLEKFFDRVNHDKLMARVARKVKDKRVLKLIRAYLNAGIMEQGVCVRTTEGTPQGGPLSPLLANILLDDLDRELGKRGHRFVRYADDCNIYVQSQRAGERVMEGVRRFVEGQLKLRVNTEKSAVDRPWKRKFLGFSFGNGKKEPKVRIAPKTLKRFKEKIREITERSKSESLEARIGKLNTYLRGWLGYYRLAETPSIFESLDKWIRRRLRMNLLKQWKKPKTKRRNLVSLGIPKEWASLISGSRKGCWRLSNTPQMNKALGFTYWKSQGLFDLVENYLRLRKSL